MKKCSDSTVATGKRILKAAIVAAHTDDAEVGAGGTALNLAGQGHEVLIVNMTSTPDYVEVGRKGARMIGASVEYMNFEQGGIIDNLDSFKRLELVLDKYRPDMIFTHWPVDEHPDHRACGAMTIRYVTDRQQEYIKDQKNKAPGAYCPQLMFYEAITGKQSKCFKPDVYVDLPQEVFEKKKELMRLYTGNPMTGYGSSWYKHHLLMMEFRARESGACRHAEIDAGIWAEAFAIYPIPRGKSRLHLPGER